MKFCRKRPIHETPIFENIEKKTHTQKNQKNTFLTTIGGGRSIMECDVFFIVLFVQLNKSMIDNTTFFCNSEKIKKL